MSEERLRAAYQVELAERAHEAAKAFRNKKSGEFRNAEIALNNAYFKLVARREALALIKDE